MSATPHIELIPLGGLGEFGMNLMVVRLGADCLVLDAGLMFPRAGQPGIELILPDLAFLEDCGTIHGLLLTHGHEDHIGAVPDLLARHDVPVLSTDYTRRLLLARLAESAPDRLGARFEALPVDGERRVLGPFEVETVRAGHSTPQCRMLVLRTPAGTLVHTSDFKLAHAVPPEESTDLGRLAEIGREGVLALLADSTNADRPGFTPGEESALGGIDRLLGAARGRVFVSTFASNVQRIRGLGRLALRHGRRLALLGSALENHAAHARSLGLLGFPPDVRVTVEQAMDLPPRRALIVATGSQGEPLSAMARIAAGRHREAAVGDGDLVIHSARVIPGNEVVVGRMFDRLLRHGAEVARDSGDRPVHVSGHASADELRLLLSLLRPRFLVPVHGDYRQLHAHARLAVDAEMPRDRVLLAETGDLVAISPEEIVRAGRVPVGKRMIDSASRAVDASMLRDRLRLAAGGVVVPVIVLDRRSGTANGYPVLVTRGLASDDADSDREADWIDEAKRIVIENLAQASGDPAGGEPTLEARIARSLRRFLQRRTGRNPLVIPVILEH